MDVKEIELKELEQLGKGKRKRVEVKYNYQEPQDAHEPGSESEYQRSITVIDEDYEDEESGDEVLD
jgi:hypothetical protein